MSGRRGIYGLLAAHGISALGTAMTFLALPWFVLSTTGSATITGLAALTEMLPYVLAQGLGGPLVDRAGARRASVGTDLGAALAMGAVPLLHHANLLAWPFLFAAMACVGALRGAGDVARRVLLPPLAAQGELPLERASGLLDGFGRLAGLLGGPLAGALIALSSAPAVLALDAASFAFSALLVALLTERCGDAAPEATPYLEQLREGLAYLKGDRLLLGAVAMIAITNLLDQAYASVLLPVWVRRELGSPVALGTLFGAFGIGAVSGNAFMAWLAPRLPRRLPFALCFMVAGVPRFLVPVLVPGFAPVLAVAFASGLGAGGLNPVLSAVEYERVPAALQARVLGTVGALAWAGIPFGGLAGGFLSDGFGLRAAFLVCGAAYFLATLSPFVFPVWREMERKAQPCGCASRS